jgi:hypothetical protein
MSIAETRFDNDQAWDDSETAMGESPVEISLEQAQDFKHFEGDLDLSTLKTISAEVAAVLATQYGGDLNLDGLEHISDEVAMALSSHSGHWLSLNGLKALSADAAQALASHDGDGLCLDGITCLTDEAAESLCRGVAPKEGEPWVLSLGGVRQLSRKAADSLSRFHSRGKQLEEKRDREIDKEYDRREALRAQAEDIEDENEVGWSDEDDDDDDEYEVENNYPRGWDLRLHGLEALESPKLAMAYFGGGQLTTLKAVSVDVINDCVAHTLPIALGMGELTEKMAAALGHSKAAVCLNGLPVLTAECARHLASQHGLLSLNGLEVITDEVAATLARHTGLLQLNGLRSLSLTAAGFLAAHSGPLSLDGLSNIDEHVAELLGRHIGCLSLNGVAHLSEQAALLLHRHKAKLSMKSLWSTAHAIRDLRPGLAGLMARTEGELELNLVDELSQESANNLAPHVGKLSLNGLRSISEGVACTLSQRQGHWRLSLDGVTHLTADAAVAISEHEGYLSLNGLERLPNDVARALARHKGWKLALDGVKTLSDEAAICFAKKRRRRHLSLKGIESLSDIARGALRTLPDIDLSTVGKWGAIKGCELQYP